MLHCQGGRDGLARDATLRHLAADTDGPVEDPRLHAALGIGHRDDPGIDLLVDPRRAGHEVRSEVGKVIDDLVNPTVNGTREANLQLCRQQHLAKRVSERKPQQLELVSADQSKRLDRGTLVRPVRVRELNTLGPTSGAGGVDQGCEVVGTHGRVGNTHRGGMGAQQSPSAAGEIFEGDDPFVGAGGEIDRQRIEKDHSLDRRDLRALLEKLRELRAILGYHEPRSRVAEDERDVISMCRGIDRGGGSSGAHHREIGKDPFQARRAGDRDPLLGTQAQRKEAGGEFLDAFATAGPTPGLPAAPGAGGSEGLALGIGGDPGVEHAAQGSLNRWQLLRPPRDSPCARD
ncbi:unannotated protein [freshwater metagenome]|uniref:Unannotated protein n=1 Tax=freshwater metagenome TaxID=449393 RepID=A0A6J7JNT6_9ZZZZ